MRIFEGIIGVFQDAHFSKTVRIFEGAAHLRTRAPPRTRQGTALDPVPLTRKVAQTRATAARLSTDDLDFHFALLPLIRREVDVP